MPPSGSNPPPTNPDTIIWTLVPYWLEDGALKSEAYDVSAYKVELAALFHELQRPWIMQPVLHSTTAGVISQIQECAKSRPTLVFNLCDGYDEVGVPGLSVVKALELAGLPFTGANSRYYETSCSKIKSKELFVKAGVPTATWEVLPDDGPLTGLCQRLGQPLFIKPASSCASYGIALKSVIRTDEEAATRRDTLKRGELAQYFAEDVIYAEDFIDGPEFTVLIGGYWNDPENIWTIPPAERVFDSSIPENERFLSFDRCWGYFQEERPPEAGRPFYVYRAASPEQSLVLCDVAKRAFIAVWGCGYGRVDIRFNKKKNEYQVLEVNANCELSGDKQTTCGGILDAAGYRFSAMVEKILEQAAHEE